MMTRAQSDALLVQMRASYATQKDGVEWWKAAVNGVNVWVMRRHLPNGLVEMRQAPCGC